MRRARQWRFLLRCRGLSWESPDAAALPGGPHPSPPHPQCPPWAALPILPAEPRAHTLLSPPQHHLPPPVGSHPELSLLLEGGLKNHHLPCPWVSGPTRCEPCRCLLGILSDFLLPSSLAWIQHQLPSWSPTCPGISSPGAALTLLAPHPPRLFLLLPVTSVYSAEAR